MINIDFIGIILNAKIKYKNVLWRLISVDSCCYLYLTEPSVKLKAVKQDFTSKSYCGNLEV